IVPSLGATRYTVGPDRLDSQAQGENAPFNQTILRFPGVAQDSFGQLHVRGEHANLQYRIDDVLLPESIPGFGQELETRFADNTHAATEPYKLFRDFSYIFDETSRLTLLLSGNHSDFQIPNNPGQMGALTVLGRSAFDSSKLDENQTEQSSYAILTYQKKLDDFSMQASIFTRYSSVLFRPDEVGDLIFNGVASRVDRDILSNGI